MPTKREIAPNKPLAGQELRAILRDYFEKLLDAEGLLSSHLAYGRIAGRLSLTLQVDNAFAPQSVTTIDVRPAGVNVVERQPELAALETFPLTDASPDAVTSSHAADFHITSPNAERIRHGLPVTVEVRQQDSTMTTEQVRYPKDDSLGPGDVTISDTSSKPAAPPPKPPTPEEAAAVTSAKAEERDFWGGASAAKQERDPSAPWPTTERT